MPELRRAEAGDLEALIDVFLDCWTISYAGVLPDRLVSAMTRDRAREIWAGTLASPATELVAAVAAGPGGDGESPDGTGSVIGMVGFSLPASDEGYVASLYVSPRAQGSGAGRVRPGQGPVGRIGSAACAGVMTATGMSAAESRAALDAADGTLSKVVAGSAATAADERESG